MKKIYTFIKANFMNVFISIIIYQTILTIFFFTTTNLRILAVLIVILAIKIIFFEYKTPIKDFFKNLFKKNK